MRGSWAPPLTFLCKSLVPLSLLAMREAAGSPCMVVAVVGEDEEEEEEDISCGLVVLPPSSIVPCKFVAAA